MKILTALLGAVILSAALITQAQAHPHSHHGHAPAPAPAWIKLEPEQVMSFDHDSSYYTVWNTHYRGLFGVELIEIRNSSNRAVAGWWTTRGWCFTENGYHANACFSQSGYERFFIKKLATAGKHVSYSGSAGDSGSSDDFCDHYSKLEATISEDTSGNCGY